ncbi:hypothetical protein UY456_23330 [Paenibacillus polymyxa]|uniref:hypothetical protein n=1 Tax=Paenibacillus polymyxa TaxID=1406 RepID=UPI002AB3568C|nr:hypothetical protein [Paenibacillus polymyxa]MDY8095905.1 hypothetical protein [Paenibacillus polymyxa]
MDFYSFDYYCTFVHTLCQTYVSLVKGQVIELKFAFEGKKVLEKISSVYTKEFAAGSNV